MRDPFRAARFAIGTVLFSRDQAREKERQRLLRMHEDRGRKARKKLLESHKQPLTVHQREKGRSRRKRKEQRQMAHTAVVFAKSRTEVLDAQA